MDDKRKTKAQLIEELQQLRRQLAQAQRDNAAPQPPAAAPGKELERQYEYVRVTLNAIADAVIAADAHGQVSFMNAAAEALTGWRQAEAIGQQVSQVCVVADAHGQLLDAHPLLAVLQQRRVMGLPDETVLLTRDGRRVPIDDSAAPIYDQQGALIGAVLVFRDISERKHAEQALQISEQRFRLLVEQSPLSTQILAPDGRTLQVNRAWEQLWGVTLEQIPEYNLLHDPQLEIRGIMSYIQRGFAGESVEIPAVMYDPNQTLPDRTSHADPRRWVRAFIYPVKDDNGQIREVVLIHEDITARTRAEEATRFMAEASSLLAASLNYTTTLQQVARLATLYMADICIVDILQHNGNIQRMAVAHVDPAKQPLLEELQQRYPPRRGRPHPVISVLDSGVPEMSTETTNELIHMVAQDERHLQLMRELNFRSHIIVPLLARGRTLGSISLVRSDSGRRYTEADLGLAEELARRAALAVDNARLYQEAQLAIHARDQFLSIAAHELKTPVTALLGYAQLLQRRALGDLALKERDLKALQTLISQARRMQILSHSLLDLSRLQLGIFTIEPHRIDLAALARRVVDELTPTLDQHQIALHLPAEPVLLEADEIRLEQVLYNLLQNAVKYSPGGGLVRASITANQEQVLIQVLDEGIGIPASALPHLFERFYRAENVDPQQIAGMGLGLFVVQEIVRLHGGSVSVQSTEGQGSCFSVRLPRHPAGAEPAAEG